LPGNAHGLKFHVGADLLSSEASLQRGTFTDYLDVRKIPWQKGDRISLRDALGCVVEMHTDNRNFDPNMGHTQWVHEASCMFTYDAVAEFFASRGVILQTPKPCFDTR
jgi:hypothetical protein